MCKVSACQGIPPVQPSSSSSAPDASIPTGALGNGGKSIGERAYFGNVGTFCVIVGICCADSLVSFIHGGWVF
jgi:hypothetical protein